MLDMVGDHPSMRENAEGYFLTARRVDWLKDHYLPRGTDRRDPIASPLYAADLSGQPPARVVTAEFDPLRDEAEAYADRLRHAGVAATAVRHHGLVHGFFRMAALSSQARDGLTQAVGALRDALGDGAGG
jgi:acetyl esterase